MNLAQWFGARVLHFRTAKGFTQMELAAELGQSRQYVSDVERGRRNLTLKSASAVIDACGLEPETFFAVDPLELFREVKP